MTLVRNRVMHKSLGQLFKEKDWDQLVARCNSSFGTSATAQQLQDKADRKMMVLGWSDSSWLCWLKSRLLEIGPLPAKPDTSPDIHFSCELHVGFTQIEETEEMLCRLRNERCNYEYSEPRTKLTKDNPIFAEPVDITAARVVVKDCRES